MEGTLIPDRGESVRKGQRERWPAWGSTSANLGMQNSRGGGAVVKDRTRVASCSQVYRPPEPRERGHFAGGLGAGRFSAF